MVSLQCPITRFLLAVYLLQYLRGTYCQQQVSIGRSSNIERRHTLASNHGNNRDEIRAARINRAITSKDNNHLNTIKEDDEDQCFGDFITDCLRTHDKYRSMHGVPFLKADKKVDTLAQQRIRNILIPL